MKKSPLEKIVEGGVRFLSEFFPLKTNLYFPLIYSSLVWIIRRTKEWKEKIFSWKVWPDPRFIKAKPDEFVLSFFKNNPALSKTYEDDIKEENLKSLREAFSRLYPIIGLEDPFLSALFLEELESGDFRKVVKEFDRRVTQAKEDIDAIKDKSKLLDGLKKFAGEIVSLNLDLISQAKIQKTIADLIKEQIDKGKK